MNAQNDNNPKDRILVVDDEPALLEMMLDTLSECGFEVRGAASGAEALGVLKEGDFHAALVDYQLGDTTGLALAKDFRQADPELCVVLMTAHASLDMAVKAIQADVYDYLIKPVDMAHLRKTLAQALEKRRLAREVKALVADLKSANLELSRLNELKSKFLSMVTHDLRTPLTSIKGYAQVLLTQDDLTDAQRKKFTKVVVREADHLSGLIGDLMDFVSMEAGKLRVEKKPESLAGLLDDLKTRMTPLAEQKKIKLKVTRPKDLPGVEMDRKRIDQALTNLVSNALKHTPEGGQVTVEAAAADGALRVDVIDTGEGIPPDDLPRVFEQFYQVETHASRRDGIGMGLSIVHEILQAHGGGAGVHSDGPGRGSRFWITLPLP